MKNRFPSLASTKILFGLIAILMTLGVVYGQSEAEQAGTFRNPLNVNDGADPWLASTGTEMK